MLTRLEEIPGGISVSAPAKINIDLFVTGKREDGYHLLRTIMRKVPVFDRVNVYKKAEKGISLSCNIPSVPCDDKNLAHKAAVKYLSLFPESFDGVHIELIKAIPHGAGMGGGSSDCAAVLLALDMLFQKGKSTELLIKESASLGADVPFFINISSDCCLCEGIGEIMTDIEISRPLVNACIVKGNGSASTKEIFTLFDDPERKSCVSITPDSPGIFASGKAYDIAKLLKNDLMEVTEKLVSSVSENIKALMELGALNAVMTGSGSAVFGIFDNEQDAIKAEKCMKEKGNFAKAVLI